MPFEFRNNDMIKMLEDMAKTAKSTIDAREGKDIK